MIAYRHRHVKSCLAADIKRKKRRRLPDKLNIAFQKSVFEYVANPANNIGFIYLREAALFRLECLVKRKTRKWLN